MAKILKTQPQSLSIVRRMILLKLIKDGATMSEACKELHIARSTIRNWCESDFNFANDLEEARLISARKRYAAKAETIATQRAADKSAERLSMLQAVESGEMSAPKSIIEVRKELKRRREGK